jgi:hypothetical protein
MLRLGLSLTLIAAIAVGQALAVPCLHVGMGSKSGLDHMSQPHFHWNLGAGADCCQHHAGHDDHQHAANENSLCGCQLHDHDGTACYLSQSVLIVSASSRQLLDRVMQGMHAVVAVCHLVDFDQPAVELGLTDANSLGCVALRASSGDFLATQRLQL